MSFGMSMSTSKHRHMYSYSSIGPKVVENLNADLENRDDLANEQADINQVPQSTSTAYPEFQSGPISGKDSNGAKVAPTFGIYNMYPHNMNRGAAFDFQ